MFIGDFGEERAPLDLEFGWCGERFRVHPDATDIGFMEFMASAQEVELPADIDMDTLSNDPARAIQVMNTMNTATHAMHRFIRGQIHPDDWDRFLAVAKAKRQQTSDLMRLSHNLTAAIARFPTGQSDDSAPTPPPTNRKSQAVSSSTERRHRAQDNADKLLAGRPDLRLALARQRQEQDAAEV